MSMYVTVQEFKNAPTGIDPLSIIPGGTEAQNDAELYNVLMRASAWVDQTCQQQTLEATVNTETKEVTMNNKVLIRVHPDMMPIIELQDSVQYRVTPAGPWIPLPMQYIQVFQRYFVIYNLNQTSISPALATMYPTFGYFTAERIKNLQQIPLTIQYTYVNGYANTTLTDSVNVGQTTGNLAKGTGVYVGQNLTIYDNQYSENVTIQAINGNAVTFASPLIFAHNASTSISAIPASVKQATILMAGFFIKERGTVTISMGQTNPQGLAKGKDVQDIVTAKALLNNFKRGVIS